MSTRRTSSCRSSTIRSASNSLLRVRGGSASRSWSRPRIAGEALLANDVPRFLKAMDGFFRSIPYSLTDRQNEQMWQTIVWTVLKSVGVYANGEVQTADGRVDMTVETPTDVYLIEFKLDDTAANAIAQIREKDYAAPFALSQKSITLIGLGFSAEQLTITDRAAEAL